ncbi:alpha-ketoglutarate-dependent dioxygenase AlkB family protein [Thalassotalea piscium]
MKLAIKEANIDYYPNFISLGDSYQYLKALYDSICWRQDQMFMFNRTVDIPRLQAWYADPSLSYSYSQMTLTPNQWTPLLSELRDKVNLFCQSKFNAVLANCYRDHRDSVSWHCDDERELGENPSIASLSFGATRDFCLKHKKGGESLKLPLQSGSLLVMGDKSQECYQHALPKSRIEQPMRINLTFRQIKHQ